MQTDPSILSANSLDKNYRRTFPWNFWRGPSSPAKIASETQEFPSIRSTRSFWLEGCHVCLRCRKSWRIYSERLQTSQWILMKQLQSELRFKEAYWRVTSKIWFCLMSRLLHFPLRSREDFHSRWSRGIHLSQSLNPTSSQLSKTHRPASLSRCFRVKDKWQQITKC